MMIISLFSCSKAPTTYKEYSEIHITSWDDVESHLTDGTFLIYYYSPYCPDCNSIQEEFSKTIYKRDNRYVIYLMISMSVDEQGIPPIELKGVPALFVYQNREFIKMILGASQVIEYVKSL